MKHNADSEFGEEVAGWVGGEWGVEDLADMLSSNVFTDRQAYRQTGS